MRPVKCIKIDPFTRAIEASEIDGDDFRSIYSAIGQDMFTAVRLDEFNVLYVDDEGMFRENQAYFAWGHQTHLAGKGVVLGMDDHGETVDATLPIELIKRDVKFYRVQPIWQRMTHSEGKMDHPSLGKNVSVFRSEPVFDPPGILEE